MEDENRRKQRACKLVREALKGLKEAEELLRTMSLNDAADQLFSNILKLETTVIDVLPQLGAPKMIQVERHRFEAPLKQMWGEVFPAYGTPSNRDRAAINEMFETFDSAYPTATEPFLRRMVENYRASTVDWCDSKEMHIFCRNFRKFAKAPQLDQHLRKLDAPAVAASATSRIAFGESGRREVTSQ